MYAHHQILRKAEAYIKNWFSDQLSPEVTYHNLEHTMFVKNAAAEIGQAEGLDEEEMEILMLAAIFHDAGHTKAAENHESRSQQIADAFLEEYGYPKASIAKVKNAIAATKMPQSPQSKVEACLCDADLSHLASEKTLQISLGLRDEWEKLHHKTLTEREWLETNYQFMIKHQYFTNYGKKILQEKKEKNIAKIKKQIFALQEK